jgi:hypothetical protein
MPLGIWSLEWLNLNSQRNYPLSDDATGLDVSGGFALPDDMILELDLPVHAGMDVDPARFLVLHVGAYSTGYSVIVGYQPASGPAVVVASALIPRQTHTPNTAYALGGVAPFDDTVGKVVVGRLENADNQPPGFWTFDLAGARLATDAVRPMIRGVSALVCVNGGQRSSPLYGDVELVAGQNIQIVPLSDDPPQVRISAIEGSGLSEQCVCEGDSALTPPVSTVNGVAPTTAGDFNVVGSDCVQVVPIANGIKIVDTCSKPCCGPAELERITRDLDRLGSEAASVQQFVDRLQESVNTMDLVVLGAKLGDRGCS